MKLAIVKSNQDLLRIIPLIKEASVEFKISTLGNNYTIEYWHQGIHDPEVYATSSEITYHSSTYKDKKLLPGVVHVKKADSLGEVTYKYRFPKVADILIDNEFRIPLLKLVIAEPVTTRYREKPYHFVFDFDDAPIVSSNVVEIYVGSRDFDPESFRKKWPNIDGLWETTSIEYVTKGVHLSQHFLDALKSGRASARIGYKFENFDFVFRFYRDEREKGNKICFYENYDYVSMLGTAPIQLIDDKTNEPLSPVKPAFHFDLNWQIQRGVNNEEIELWYEFFNASLERMNRLGLERPIFLIPQI